MVRDIKKDEDYTFIKDVFPNEIEVNLFIFPDIKITINYFQVMKQLSRHTKRLCYSRFSDIQV
jgi:hypothetical protein